jgi:hypothetical protein
MPVSDLVVAVDDGMHTNCLALIALPDVAMDWRVAPPLCVFGLRLAIVAQCLGGVRLVQGM